MLRRTLLYLVKLIKIRAIKNGPGVTYHYGRNYVDAFIKAVGCKCASALALKRNAGVGHCVPGRRPGDEITVARPDLSHVHHGSRYNHAAAIESIASSARQSSVPLRRGLRSIAPAMMMLLRPSSFAEAHGANGTLEPVLDYDPRRRERYRNSATASIIAWSTLLSCGNPFPREDFNVWHRVLVAADRTIAQDTSPRAGSHLSSSLDRGRWPGRDGQNESQGLSKRDHCCERARRVISPPT